MKRSASSWRRRHPRTLARVRRAEAGREPPAHRRKPAAGRAQHAGEAPLLDTRDTAARALDPSPASAAPSPSPSPAPGLEAVLAAHRRRVEERLAVLAPRVAPAHGALAAALADSVLAPAKRLRPLMTVLVAEALGGSVETATDAGCAVEMVHAASLVLDDLPSMDDARLRRGKPAVHVAHGEDVAILVAVGALASAFRLLSGLESLPPLARAEAVAVLADAVGFDGLVGGQFDDLHGGRARRGLDEIAAANGRKTGALFCAAAEIGGLVAGADAATRQTLCRFAAELGHAFQLLDDLLDGSPSAQAIGKDVGKDAGKSTIVSLVGRREAGARIEGHVEAASARLTDLFGARSTLHGFTDAIFAMARARSAPVPA